MKINSHERGIENLYTFHRMCIGIFLSHTRHGGTLVSGYVCIGGIDSCLTATGVGKNWYCYGVVCACICELIDMFLCVVCVCVCAYG